MTIWEEPKEVEVCLRIDGHSTRSLSVWEARKVTPIDWSVDVMYMYVHTQLQLVRLIISLPDMESYHTLDFVVKETPVKKQVEHYRRFKLQRLRWIMVHVYVYTDVHVPCRYMYNWKIGY